MTNLVLQMASQRQMSILTGSLADMLTVNKEEQVPWPSGRGPSNLI